MRFVWQKIKMKMGKKSRSNKNNANGTKTGKDGDDDGNSNINSNSNSNSNSNNALQVSIDGRMPERDGRRFYDLLTFLAEIAVPLLEVSRRKHLTKFNYEPLGWKRYDVHTQSMGMAANSYEIRDIVMSYILISIDLLIDEINSKKHDALFISIFNRHLTENDKKEIQSWKMHVMDDFFYINTRPNEGGIFVQCGKLKLMSSEFEFELKKDDDVHEPRVFVVQGLADSFDRLMRQNIELFRQKNLEIATEYPTATICLVNTTILPYNGGITYMSTMKQPQEYHYKSPKDLADAIRTSIQAVNTVFVVEEEEAAFQATGSGSYSGSPQQQQHQHQQRTSIIYRNLNPETDSYICRHAVNQKHVPAELAHNSHFKSNNTNPNISTSILTQQMYWKPTEIQNDPQMEPITRRVVDGPKPFLLEGMKYAVHQEMLVDDDDICPFHNEKALGKTPKWKDCCKSDYLYRCKKANRTNNHRLTHIMYEPLTEEESKTIFNELEQFGGTFENPLNITDYTRLGYMDIGLVRLKVPLDCVPTLTDAFHRAQIYHSVLPHKWIYLGHCPFNIPGMGIMCFGDIQIDPLTGYLTADCMTARRLTELIILMKMACTIFDAPILEANIEMQSPSHKIKPDEKMFIYNQELLQQDLEANTVITQSSIDDKKEHEEGMRRSCALCGVDRKEDGSNLMKCPCKLIYFCSTECQCRFWPNHKDQCKAARERLSVGRLDGRCW